MGVDYSELEEFRDSLLNLDKVESDIAIDCLNELTGRFLAKVIKATPVENPIEHYWTKNPAGMDVILDTGKVGGTLRRGWMTPERSMKVTPKQYQMVLTNPVEYASYVEFGHRQHPGQFVPGLGDDGKGRRLVKSWVNGQFPMTKSATIIQDNAQSICERRIARALKGVIK